MFSLQARGGGHGAAVRGVVGEDHTKRIAVGGRASAVTKAEELGDTTHKHRVLNEHRRG
jgi:hypothetical protein